LRRGARYKRVGGAGAATTPKSDAFARFESYVRERQDRSVAALAEVEPTPFARKDWTRAEGGGGHMATVRGEVIEKGAVLVSSVSGAASPLTQKPFRAAGLSLILHPASPHAPTVHMNVRRFEEPDDGWWGGGMDLTPLGVRHEADVEQFHGVLRKALGARYEAGKAEAARYFYVPHRQRERGAGGVFYDHVRDAEGEALVRAIGDAFLDAYLPILRARGRAPSTEAERDQQLRDRGVYVEFNLLYDRGTRFGFQSGGNPEAILSSLPPLVRW
jgi:coproporphyrinogen III oxidase